MALPSMVERNLSAMSEEAQEQFWEEYNRNAKSGFTIFVCWLLLGWHYAYLGKWGVQLLFWLTGGGFLIWLFLDFFRIWGMVSEYNKTAAIEALKNVKVLMMESQPTMPTPPQIPIAKRV